MKKLRSRKPLPSQGELDTALTDAVFVKRASCFRGSGAACTSGSSGGDGYEGLRGWNLA